MNPDAAAFRTHALMILEIVMVAIIVAVTNY